LTPSFGHPYTPMAKSGAPTWPKREVGEPFGPFGHPLREGPTWPKKGALRPYGQNPNLRPLWPNEGGPSPTGEAPPFGPFLAKSAFGPPLPFGLWEREAPFGQRSVWPSLCQPLREGRGPSAYGSGRRPPPYGLRGVLLAI